MNLTYLYDGVHVRQEVIGTNVQEHDKSSAHILTYFWILIPGHCKQALERERERERERGRGRGRGKGEGERETGRKVQWCEPLLSVYQNSREGTLMKGRMFATRAAGMLIMNWLTQAMAWDLRQQHTH